ncbi:MAG: hypothetical protein JO144_01520 [Actinobacteria bacterium]|nr:hypothetical protein [Actinomycetota bacterium]
MAWLWWLLAPVLSTGVGAIAIWWRSANEAGHRFRRPDPVSEHQALLRALAEQPPAVALSGPGRTTGPAAVAERPAAD